MKIMENKDLLLTIESAKAMPTSKSGLSNLASVIIDSVREGEMSAVDTYIRFKSIEALTKEVMAGIADSFYSEVTNTINVKVDRPLGATLKETVTATKYDFSASTEWQKQSIVLELAKQELKNIEEKLKITGQAEVVGGGDCIVSVTLAK